MGDTQNIYITEATRPPTGDGLLSGDSVAVKDNISTAGIRTTCGSAMLEEYVPPFDATVVEAVRAAGGEIVGKTNMDEFGMGTTTETSAFGPTDNPAAPGHVPGGSSGGSAAAVAAGEADVALGSDTGGSVRCPAAFSGIVGIKPTYGLVSRYGLVAYANSLEQIGPLGATVADTARLLEVIAGPDPHDSTTRERGATTSYTDAVGAAVSGLTIGVPTELVEGADDRVRGVFWDALDALGLSYERISLPAVEHAVQAYYVIAMSEASSNLARFDGVRYGHSGGYDGNWNESFATARREGFGDEVIRRVLLGTFALSAGYQDKYYRQAQNARSWVKQAFDEAFTGVDVIASPTMPVLPFELGETIEDPLQMYLADANTTPVNLANLPAISVPAGTADGLPVGMQFVAPAFDEQTLVRVGSALEAAVG